MKAETEPEVSYYTPEEQTEISQLEFEIHSIRQYLGKLEIKYFNLTGDVT